MNRVWAVANSEFVSIADLLDELEKSPLILIGEKHGHKEHQDRETFLLRALADRKRYPILALEMLIPDLEEQFRAYRHQSPEYATNPRFQ